MSRAQDSERRRKELLLKVPKAFEIFAAWPTVIESAIKAGYLEKYKALCEATKLFLLKRPMSEIAAKAGMRPYRVLDYIEKALQPWHEGTGITGTRAFVSFLVQSPRVRRAELEPIDADKPPPMSGFGGLFGKLLTDHPEIEIKLTAFLNGRARPNKVGPKALLIQFQELCKEEGLTDKDYPLCCVSKGHRPLMRWFRTKYMHDHLLAHIRRNAGKAAAVSAGYELGDGETRTPTCDYLCWVIDECDSNLDTKTEIPAARWGAEVVRVRRFPVLRLRSIGDYAMNIAFHACFTRQAKGSDIIKLFKNAVLGQPVPPMVDKNLMPVEGAGFPQNIFEELRFVLPVIVYLDNALAHLYNDLVELLTRLCGARVVLGTPGTPKGRPEVESNIHVTRKCYALQLPAAMGTGPQDPMRKTADRPTEQLVHVNHFEQGLYCVLANENVSDTASAGYLDSFTRMRALLGRGVFEANKLPVHLRAPHNFCAPKRRQVKCEFVNEVRLPYIYLGQRYSSQWLKLHPPEGIKEYWVMRDYDDLRTVIILDDNMAYVDTLRAEGAWGRVPHDERIVQIYRSRKYKARFKTQPRDLPLITVLKHLADGAKNDWSMAQDYAYVVSYLKRMFSAEEVAAIELEHGSIETPLIYDDGYVPPRVINAPTAPTPAPTAALPPAPKPARASTPQSAPMHFRRFSIPRGVR